VNPISPLYAPLSTKEMSNLSNLVAPLINLMTGMPTEMTDVKKTVSAPIPYGKDANEQLSRMFSNNESKYR
jgi:hypothetical protein